MKINTTAVLQVRLPVTLMLRLRELAGRADEEHLSSYVRNVLEAHCESLNEVPTVQGDKPNAEQYAKYCRKLDQILRDVQNDLRGDRGKQSRTLLNRWAKIRAGEDITLWTIKQWESLFKEAESFGDLSYSNNSFAFSLVIKDAANQWDQLHPKQPASPFPSVKGLFAHPPLKPAEPEMSDEQFERMKQMTGVDVVHGEKP